MSDQPVILIVDDEPLHTRMYSAVLHEATGAAVEVAHNGADALRRIHDDPAPDLTLLDLEMPGGMSGAEVLAAIRGELRLRHMPVVVMTADASDERQLELLGQGADDFIAKGAAPGVLIARVRAQLRHHQALERLERLALDRDLFAAGVLHDISGIKELIIRQCRIVTGELRRDPVTGRTAVNQALNQLAAHASRLGAFAADVIQSVRDTQRPQAVAPQDVQAHLQWVAEVLAGGAGGGPPPLSWSVEGALRPVMADASLLRLALLNVIQRATAMAPGGARVAVSQVVLPQPLGAGARALLGLRIRDFGDRSDVDDPEDLFRPFSRLEPGRQAGGCGIGMALVARVLAMSGGRASAALPADQGPGLVVHLDFPAG